MNKKINILVLGVDGNVSQGIIKSIRNSKINANIIGGCINIDNYGFYMCDKCYVSPYAADKNFIKWLINICKDEKIDIILSGVEEVINKITKNIKIINKETKAVFVTPSYKKITMAQNKLLTCQWLKDNKCNYPDFCVANDKKGLNNLLKKYDFPFIAKPINGKGSVGLKKLLNRADIDNIEEKDKYIIEQYLGTDNDEYTIGCYADKKDNIYTIIFKRKIKEGKTIFAEVVENEIIKEECVKICKKLKIKGPVNIQLRLSDNVPICFEINLRFSGTTAMRQHFGFNDVKALIKEYIFNKDVEDCFSVKYGKAYRYDEEFYLD